MSAQPFLSELQGSGFKLFVDGDLLKITPASNLSDEQRQRIRKQKFEIIAALKSEQADRLEDFTELYHEQAGKHEYCNNLSRDEAEKLAVRTVWHYVMEKGDHGKLFSNDLTYQEARHSLEHKFQRKVSDIEFISAMAEGFGFVAYRPEIGETAQ